MLFSLEVKNVWGPLSISQRSRNDRPMQTKLPLFLNWGITFDEPYQMPERANRKIAYANKEDLISSIESSRLSNRVYNTKREERL